MKKRAISEKVFFDFCKKLDDYGQLKFSKNIKMAQSSLSQIVNKKRVVSPWLFYELRKKLNILVKNQSE